MRNRQSVNIVDLPTIQKFVHDLFYPAPVIKSTAKGTPSATPSAKPTKFNYAHLANGKSVDGGTIPCVN